MKLKYWWFFFFSLVIRQHPEICPINYLEAHITTPGHDWHSNNGEKMLKLSLKVLNIDGFLCFLFSNYPSKTRKIPRLLKLPRVILTQPPWKPSPMWVFVSSLKCLENTGKTSTSTSGSSPPTLPRGARFSYSELSVYRVLTPNYCQETLGINHFNDRYQWI